MEQLKVNNVTNGLTIGLFIIYLIALCWILLFKLGVQFSYMQERRTNLIPFNESLILRSENILNLVIFVPLGIYTGILFKKWLFGKKVFFVIILSLLVEGLEYILRLGAFDITDIITNSLGGVIGLMIFNGLKKVFSDHLKAQRFINKIAATGTAFMILLLVLLKMNMLPVRYQ